MSSLGKHWKRELFSDEYKKKISPLGRKHSDKTKEKMSLSAKGKNIWSKGTKRTEETKQKMRIARVKQKPPFLEKHHTEEAKRKISEHHKKNGIGKWSKGRKWSEEIKQKIKLSHIGKKHPWQMGEKNPNWNNGKSFENYPKDWTETLRRSIRERDNYTCKICMKQQGDETFSVHHIDYNKNNCSPDNLITLCHQCHSKTNHNREEWIKYFNK